MAVHPDRGRGEPGARDIRRREGGRPPGLERQSRDGDDGCLVAHLDLRTGSASHPQTTRDSIHEHDARSAGVKPHASPVFHAIPYLLGNLDRFYLTELRAAGGIQSCPSGTKDADRVDFRGSVRLGAAAPLFAGRSRVRRRILRRPARKPFGRAAGGRRARRGNGSRHGPVETSSGADGCAAWATGVERLPNSCAFRPCAVGRVGDEMAPHRRAAAGIEWTASTTASWITSRRAAAAMGASEQTLDRARRLMCVGRHDQALSELSGHLTAAPGDVEALCLAALCLLGERNAVGADRAAEAATHADPSWEAPFRIRSIALTRLRRFDEALEMAREAARLAPALWQTHSQLATAFVNRGMLKEADQAARRAVRLAPSESDAHLTLAIVADARMRRRQERQELRRALELDPDNAMALNTLAALGMQHVRFGRSTRGSVVSLEDEPRERVLHANLDAVGMRLVARLLQTMLFGGVGLAILLGSEPDVAVPTWWPRATLGAVLLGACTAFAWNAMRAVPRGSRGYLRGVPARARGRDRLTLVLLVLSAPMVLWFCFMPSDVAGAALVLLGTLVTVVQVMLVVWLAVTASRWVRASF